MEGCSRENSPVHCYNTQSLTPATNSITVILFGAVSILIIALAVCRPAAFPLAVSADTAADQFRSSTACSRIESRLFKCALRVN